MNYSLLRSKTFWTIVLMFIMNGFQAISSDLNPSFVLIANALLTAISSYFHLETGKSTLGAN
jgi:hypothetical protein